MVDGGELLAPVEEQPHRPPGRPRERRGVRLEVKLALAAEAAAQRRDNHADVALGELQSASHPRTRGERRLRRAPDRYPPSVPLRQRGVRLDRYGMRHVGFVALRDDHVRLC